MPHLTQERRSPGRPGSEYPETGWPLTSKPPGSGPRTRPSGALKVEADHHLEVRGAVLPSKRFRNPRAERNMSPPVQR